MTQFTQGQFEFQSLHSRQVLAAIDRGKVSSDAGGFASSRGRRAIRSRSTVCGLLHRSSGSRARRALARRTPQAAGLWTLSGLRRSQRPRSASPRSAHGRARRQERSARARSRPQESGQTFGRQKIQRGQAHFQSAYYSSDPESPFFRSRPLG